MRAPDATKEAVAVALVGVEDRMGFQLMDWDLSAWQGEHYLGRMLSRQEALASPQKSTFLRIAEHVVRDLPQVEPYLAQRP